MTPASQSNRERMRKAAEAWDKALQWTLDIFDDRDASPQAISQAMKFLSANGVDLKFVEGSQSTGESHDLNDPEETDYDIEF